MLIYAPSTHTTLEKCEGSLSRYNIGAGNIAIHLHKFRYEDWGKCWALVLSTEGTILWTSKPMVQVIDMFPVAAVRD